jgi:hypothetical protein
MRRPVSGGMRYAPKLSTRSKAQETTHEAHHRGQVCMLANQLGFVAERGSVRDLELGKTVERVRVAWRPRL